MLDLDTIEGHMVAAFRDGNEYVTTVPIPQDMRALFARVRELEAALSEQSQTVQREWLSPFEKEGWRQEIVKAERQRCLGIIESRMHTTDDTDEGAELWSELDNLRQKIESKDYGA